MVRRRVHYECKIAGARRHSAMFRCQSPDVVDIMEDRCSADIDMKIQHKVTSIGPWATL